MIYEWLMVIVVKRRRGQRRLIKHRDGSSLSFGVLLGCHAGRQSGAGRPSSPWDHALADVAIGEAWLHPRRAPPRAGEREPLRPRGLRRRAGHGTRDARVMRWWSELHGWGYSQPPRVARRRTRRRGATELVPRRHEISAPIPEALQCAEGLVFVGVSPCSTSSTASTRTCASSNGPRAGARRRASPRRPPPRRSSRRPRPPRGSPRSWPPCRSRRSQSLRSPRRAPRPGSPASVPRCRQSQSTYLGPPSVNSEIRPSMTPVAYPVTSPVSRRSSRTPPSTSSGGPMHVVGRRRAAPGDRHRVLGDGFCKLLRRHVREGWVEEERVEIIRTLFGRQRRSGLVVPQRGEALVAVEEQVVLSTTVEFRRDRRHAH